MLKYLALAGGLLIGTSAFAQDIPQFKRTYVADPKIPLVTAKGPILWMSEEYTVHNSEPRTIYELRGYIDIPVKIIGIRIEAIHFKLGAITRIDGNSIESIIYGNTPQHETMSEYDRMVAQKEGIDTDQLKSLWHERYDLSDSTITNLETGEIRPMDGAREFQQLYFNIPKHKDMDTLVKLHFCGKDYPVNIKINNGLISADLTYPDPKDPSKRKELIEGIKSMSVYPGKDGLPYKMVADAKFGMDFRPEAKYDPKKKWEDRR